MAVAELTKNMFAEELIRMVSEIPFEKVRVGDLCRRCNADRRTFYYHFMDKYDLIAWIFTRDYSESYNAEKSYTLRHSINILEKMFERKEFYKAVWSDHSQNAIRNYAYQYFYQLGTDAIKKHFGIEKLSAEDDYAVRMHGHACVEISFEWLNGEVNYTPEEFARLQYHFMPDVLKAGYGIEGTY